MCLFFADYTYRLTSTERGGTGACVLVMAAQPNEWNWESSDQLRKKMVILAVLILLEWWAFYIAQQICLMIHYEDLIILILKLLLLVLTASATHWEWPLASLGHCGLAMESNISTLDFAYCSVSSHAHIILTTSQVINGTATCRRNKHRTQSKYRSLTCWQSSVIFRLFFKLPRSRTK